MKKKLNTKGTLEALLVIGLILIIPLFFVMRTAAEQNAAQNALPSTAVIAPSLPTAANAPEESSALAPKQPPACTFPLAQITTAESTPEKYTFSEPQVVLNANHNLYNIVEWLPDNQQVLITQDLYNTRKNEADHMLRQSIELYNPETGESKVYAIRYRIDEPPSWQSNLNAVVYPAMNFLGIDANTNQLKFTRQAWVSREDSKSAQMLTDYLPQFYLAVQSGSSATLYLSDKKISKRDRSLKDTEPVSFDMTQWDYVKGRRSEIPLSYKMAWQPGTAFMFLYGDGAQRFAGYTFILNTNTGQVCELNLGGWAIKARWSSDGRYLAIIRAHEHFPISSSDLAVLDAVTGNVYTARVTPEKEKGKHYVDDIVWAPDSYHLLAIGSFSPYTNPSDGDQSRLYLVDFLSGQSDDILPTYTFYAASSKDNLAWSPDGSKLLARCPTIQDEQICFIKVQRIGQR
jgi:hypothetical protein